MATENRKVLTKRGTTEYYILEGIYPNRTTIYVKFPQEESEHEIIVEESTSEAQYEAIIKIYSAGYEQGRHRGLWEKGQKLRKIFSELRALST